MMRPLRPALVSAIAVGLFASAAARGSGVRGPEDVQLWGGDVDAAIYGAVGRG